MTALLADLTVLIHLLWIIFVLCGLLLAWRRPGWAWPHLLAVVGLIVINLGGWYCPLTHLEVWLRGQAALPGISDGIPAGACEVGSGFGATRPDMGVEALDPALAYPGSFLFYYIERLIYLPLPEIWLRGAALVWAALNLLGYALLWRTRRRGRGGRREPPGPDAKRLVIPR